METKIISFSTLLLQIEETARNARIQNSQIENGEIPPRNKVQINKLRKELKGYCEEYISRVL